jgi:hypothetical protein
MMISNNPNQKKQSQPSYSKRVYPQRIFGSSYWYIYKGLMKVSKDYYRTIDNRRFTDFNYFFSENDCIQEIERTTK